MNKRFGGLVMEDMVALKDIAVNGGGGTVGPPGPAGADGQDGADGATGSPGPAGADGAQGPQGIPGNDGAQGPAGTVEPMQLADYGIDSPVIDELKTSTLKTYLESHPTDSDVYWMMAGVIEYLGDISKGK